MINFLKNLSNSGIPFPVLRDCVTKLPSITYTFFVLSGFVVLLGIIGKASKLLDIDLQQALYWNLTCGGFYLGRKMQQNGKEIQINETIKDVNESK